MDPCNHTFGERGYCFLCGEAAPDDLEEPAAEPAPEAEVEAAPEAPVQLPVVTNPFQYAYDFRSARCNECSLDTGANCDLHMPGRPPSKPENFNGLMIVWGYPTHRAIRTGDATGGEYAVLRRTFKDYGIDYDVCYVTNAVACNIPTEFDLNKLPANIYSSCRYKLMTEVEHIKPRVILALGNIAFRGVMGASAVRYKQEPFDCPECSNVRTWRLWGCAKCKHAFMSLPFVSKEEQPEGTPWDVGCACTDEMKLTKTGRAAKPPRWQKRVIKCGTCNGLKTRKIPVTTYACEYNLFGKGGVAGGLFDVQRTPFAHLYGEDETAYVLSTYNPHKLRQKAETTAQKKIGGQFLVPAFDAHIAKVARTLRGERPLWDLDYTVTTNPFEVREFVEEGGWYDLDIETDDKDEEQVTDIRCVGLHRRSDGKVLVVNTAGCRLTEVEDPLIEELRRFVSRDDVLLCMQHGNYDVRVMRRMWRFPIPPGWRQDTMRQHQLLLRDAPHDLGHIAFQFTDAPPWKPPKNANGHEQWESSDQLHLYNARDCRATGLAAERMQAELEAEGIAHLLQMDMEKIRIGLEMEETGIAVNRRVMLENMSYERLKEEEGLRAMRQLVGLIPDEVSPHNGQKLISDNAKKTAQAEKRDPRLFNPNSTNQLRYALYDPRAMGLAPRDPKTMSADKTALLPHTEHPFVQALLKWRGASKRRSTLEEIPVGVDGRFHPRWDPVGAGTGRWTSSPNFQNWEKAMRAMVQAPKGRAFVGADASQLELRIIACLSGDETMIRLCANAREDRKLEPEYDPHSYITAISFGAQFTSLSLNDPACTAKKDIRTTCLCETCRRKMLREITKRTIYALAYGGDEHTAHKGIYDDGYDGPPISLEMVAQTKDAYFEGFAGIRPWREGVLQLARRTGYVRESFGGRYRCFPLGQIESTVAYNYPIQGAASAIMDRSIILLDRALKVQFPTARIFATVHDAVYVECDIVHAIAVANLVEECLSCRIRYGDSPWMDLPASAAIATNWKDAA